MRGKSVAGWGLEFFPNILRGVLSPGRSVWDVAHDL